MPTSQVKFADLCKYTLHENGVHELRLLTPSRGAWDAYVQLMIEVVEESLDDLVIYTILDLTCGTIPLAHAAFTYRDFTKRYAERPPIRYAVLHGDNFLMSLADSVAKSVKSRNDEIRLFHVSKYDLAVAWLLEN
jgi:hypothetical protein